MENPTTEHQQQPAQNTEQGGNKMQICVWGIEKFFDQKQCFRLFKKNFLPENSAYSISHVSKPHQKPYFYVRFSSQGDRQTFFACPISKNKKIRVKSVDYDTSQQIFHTVEELTAKNDEKRQRKKPTAAQIQEVKQTSIQDSVEPYHSLPYEQQISQKKKSLQKVIQNYNTQFFKDPQVRQQVKILNKAYQPLKLTDFIPCTGKRTEYRNKTEFTIGYDSDGKVTVGFNKGNFEDGTIMIEDPRKVTICSKRTKVVAAVLEQFIRGKPQLKAFDRFDQSGFWRYLVVRESARTNQVLMMVVAADKNIDAEELNGLHKEMIDVFKKSIIDLKGLCFMAYNQKSDSIPIETPLVLWGNGFYHEQILKNTFRVSSSAFLQGHTEMCQVLYSKIIELVSDCDVVLDLCCGIGTIGICIKNHFKSQQKNVQVIGIECCAQAVQDAKANDPDYQVVLARVQDGIKSVTQRFRGHRIVGILDPPRAGVGKDVTTALRRCRGLDHIIYVACSPSSIQDNLLQFTLPVTNKRKAPEFVIKQMFGFDLFPQTKHYEALYYLERT